MSIRSHRLRPQSHNTSSHFRRQPRMQIVSLCSWPTGYKSEFLTTSSLDLINLLEWLIELRETFYLLGYQFIIKGYNSGISSVLSLSRIQLFATPWTATCQASLSITNSWSLLKFMSTESVMSSNHLIPSSPSPPAFSFAQRQGLFQWVSSSRQVDKGLELQLQHQSFQWIFRVDFL